MKALRLMVVFAVAAGFGAYLGGCSTPQPQVECGTPAGEFWVNLKKTSGTGTCSELTGDTVGMQRYLPLGGTNPTLAIRSVALATGFDTVFSADFDPSNNCSDPENDVDEDCADCATRGTCENHADVLGRSEAADPNAMSANALGPVSLKPDKDGVCAVTGFKATRNFDAEELPLLLLPDGGPTEFAPTDLGTFDADAGILTFPALTASYEWNDLKLISTAKVPGTVFTGKLKVTMNSCVAEYDAQGIWPAIGCSADSDCNPVPNEDAGQTTGSGINPDFKPVCNTVAGFCELGVAVADIPK